MTTTFVNGYNVTGNHATVGREYRVCNAAGKAHNMTANEFAEEAGVAATQSA